MYLKVPLNLSFFSNFIINADRKRFSLMKKKTYKYTYITQMLLEKYSADEN